MTLTFKFEEDLHTSNNLKFLAANSEVHEYPVATTSSSFSVELVRMSEYIAKLSQFEVSLVRYSMKNVKIILNIED